MSKQLRFDAAAREEVLRGATVSIAGVLLLTEATLADVPERKPELPPVET